MAAPEAVAAWPGCPRAERHRAERPWSGRAGAPRARPARSKQSRQASHAFGLAAEDGVGRFLHAAGYTVLASRERGRSSEVDLIATRDDTVAFIEVKARRRGFDGLEAVGRRKRAQLTRASNEWLGKHPEYAGHTIRFDIALVWPTGLPEYIENAFEAEESDDFVF